MAHHNKPKFQRDAEYQNGTNIVLDPASKFRERMSTAINNREYRRARLTSRNKPPPCFEGVEQYRKWMESGQSAAGAWPPLRNRDGFHSEPNYCYDCSKEYRDKMCGEDRCIFPETTFETKVSDGEKFLGGVSHRIPRNGK